MCDFTATFGNVRRADGASEGMGGRPGQNRARGVLCVLGFEAGSYLTGPPTLAITSVMLVQRPNRYFARST